MFDHPFFASAYFPAVWFAPGDESAVPEEELRFEYRGGTGRMVPARDPFADGADLVAQVIDKWDAIERAREEDRQKASASSPVEELSIADPAPAELADDDGESAPGDVSIDMPVLAGSSQAIIDRSPINVGGSEGAAALLELERMERQRQEDEALLLILAAA